MATPKSEKSGPPPPTRFAVALFPGFQALDAFGPLDILNLLSKKTPLSLRILGPSLDPVSTRADGTAHTTGQAVVPTHTFADGLDDVEVLLIPGGFGTRDPANMKEVVEFVRAAYPSLRFLLTVCTGSAVAAMSGVLGGRRATSNKRAWAWVSLVQLLLLPPPPSFSLVSCVTRSGCKLR